MEEERIILQPSYVKDFKCNGIECDACCCGHWLIDIDMDTYKKYQRVKNPAMRKRILSCMKPLEGRANSFYIELNENGRCPLVGEDKLCYIQKNLGEDALSITCKTYPRAVRVVGGLELRLLMLSCPIAADAALFSENGMEICTGGVDSITWQIATRGGDIKKHDADTMAAANVILGGLSILQNTVYTREERLIILGLFLDRAEELKGDAAALANLVEYYNSEDFKQEITPLLANWKFYPQAHQQFMKDLLLLLREKNRFVALGLLYQTNIDYDRVYAEKHELLEDNVGKALDRYLQYEWLCCSFPFFLEGSFLHNYFAFLLHYKIAELYMYSVFDFSKPIPKDSIIRAIILMSKKIDHVKNFLPTIVKEVVPFENEPIKLMEFLLRLK